MNTEIVYATPAQDEAGHFATIAFTKVALDLVQSDGLPAWLVKQIIMNAAARCKGEEGELHAIGPRAAPRPAFNLLLRLASIFCHLPSRPDTIRLEPRDWRRPLQIIAISGFGWSSPDQVVTTTIKLWQRAIVVDERLGAIVPSDACWPVPGMVELGHQAFAYK